MRAFLLASATAATWVPRPELLEPDTPEVLFLLDPLEDGDGALEKQST